MPAIGWVAWVVMVMAVALSTTNPLYLAVVLLCVLLVAVFAPRTATAGAGLRGLFLLGAGMLLISLAIAVINGNAGDHVLFTLPGPRVPGWLGGLRLGGPVTAEGLVAAAIRGETILAVFLAFAVFNGAVSPHRVLRMAPAALFHAGLVVTVGLTLLPASVEDLRRIREMRALRGAGNRVRDLPALIVPAVIGGLERSMRLAEAMEARGYAAAPATPRRSQLVGALSAPLLLGAVWGWSYYDGARTAAFVAAGLGIAALCWWLYAAGRQRRATRFRAEPASPADRVLVAASIAAGVAAVGARAAGWAELACNPFDGLPAPAFAPGGAALALATAWPAFRLAFSRRPAPATAGDAHRATEAWQP